jgi:hypothetical protein
MPRKSKKKIIAQQSKQKEANTIQPIVDKVELIQAVVQETKSKNDVVDVDVEDEDDDVPNVSIDCEHDIIKNIEFDEDVEDDLINTNYEENFSWCLNDWADIEDTNDVEEECPNSFYNKIDWLIDLYNTTEFEVDDNEFVDEHYNDDAQIEQQIDDQNEHVDVVDQVDDADDGWKTIVDETKKQLECNIKTSCSLTTTTNQVIVKMKELLIDEDEADDQEQINGEDTKSVSKIKVINNVIQKLKEFNVKINNNMCDNSTTVIADVNNTTTNPLFSSVQLPTTLKVLQTYRNVHYEEIISNVDLDEQQKFDILNVYYNVQWIDDITYAVYVAALNQEWDLATKLMKWTTQHWSTLRKLFGNWEQFKDKRKLKEFCINIMKYDEKSMPTLNEWAKQYALKQCNRIIKSYCDLCVSQDCIAFVMQYSQDL